MPTWVLTVAYALHMAATVVWIGGLFFQSVILTRVVLAQLDLAGQAAFLRSIRRRFDPLAWLCLGTLVVTGLSQMSAHPQYRGFLSIANPWAAAILMKHIVIAVMVCLAAYQTWVLQPAQERLLLQGRRQAEGSDLKRLLTSQRRLTHLSLACSLLVLALTALARTS
jgi:uncharacterized membrane protein